MITQQTVLPLEYGEFTISYHKSPAGDCVSVHQGDVTTGTPLVRIHSSCLFGEAFHGLDCDCGAQLSAALQRINDEGVGVVVYHYAEGRGVGLETKIQSLELQRTRGLDTVDSLTTLGLQPDIRTYDMVTAALADLQLSSTIRAITANPKKLDALKNAGYDVTEIVQLDVPVTELNKPELLTKKHKLGYLIKNID